MARYRTQEYRHLLAAERALALALEPRLNEKGVLVYPEPRDAAMVASALTRVVDQKRVMRGQPAPKPVDVAPRTRRLKPPSAVIPMPDSGQGPTAGAPGAQA